MKNLNNIAVSAALVSALLLPSLSFANQQLATGKNCMSCHAVDKKVVGPAFKDIAAKYAGQAGSTEKLANKISKGSTGVWGAIPMPANTAVNSAEAASLAQWILTLK